MYISAMGGGRLAELRALIGRHAQRGDATAIDGVRVSTAQAPTQPTASTTGTVIALVVQGA
jgi:hypothetical protein